MTIRRGGEKRGNCYDREARKNWVLSQSKWHDDLGNTLCAFCGVTLFYGTLTIDRIQAGSAYRRDRIQPACMACNRARGTKSVIDYLLSVYAWGMSPLERSRAATLFEVNIFYSRFLKTRGQSARQRLIDDEITRSPFSAIAV